jgi:hypothetical protein
MIHATAQDDDDLSEALTEKKFYAELHRLNLNYNPPPGYRLSYVPHNAQMGRILLTESRHQLASLKDNVFVYFTEFPITPRKKIDKGHEKFGLHDNDENRNYLAIYSDTLVHPIMYHSRKFSRRKFGAERSGTYDLPLPRPYRGGYWFCKTLFIHKQDRADIVLYFFYNPGSANKVDKHITTLSKRIRFLTKIPGLYDVEMQVLIADANNASPILLLTTG